MGPDFRPGQPRDDEGRRPRQVRSVRLDGLDALGLFPKRRDTADARLRSLSRAGARLTYAHCPRTRDEELLVALGALSLTYLWHFWRTQRMRLRNRPLQSEVSRQTQALQASNREHNRVIFTVI